MRDANRKHLARLSGWAVAWAAVVLAAAMFVVADADDQYSDWSAAVNLGPTINTSSLDQGPTISKDGLSLYFHSSRPGGFGGTDIWVTQRPSVDAPWGAPQNLGPNINTASNESAPELSLDGHRMYFHSDGPGGFGTSDIYVSRRHNKRDDFGWRPAENLGSTVNTAAQEQQPCIFEDDATGVTTLYFTSNRPGGPGGLDIYASTLQADETFGWAVLVVELSSPFNDRGPGIRRDGLEIFFPSNRPGTFGFDDLWVAMRASTSDPWSVPVNVGPAVNTVSQEAQPFLSFDGTALYFNTVPLSGAGGFDLWVATRTKLKGRD
ncbi:MAG: hypothetical protein M1453_01385 [Acidobacteria bacterium]|nr:hypothetical protein [Acidobacteriota bacterium]MCL5286634.1 hypothetical protein [Acidobacteriota bacterium]